MSKPKGCGLYKVVNGRVKCTACREWVPHATIVVSSGRAICATCVAERATRLPESQRLSGAAYQPHMPTPEQIALAAAAIRAEWSPAELTKRMAEEHRPYEVPVVSRSACQAAMDCRARVGGTRGI